MAKKQVDKGPKIQSSINDIRAFQSNIVWRDIVAYIEYRRAGNETILRKSLDHRALLRSQGAIDVAENIIQLPEELIETLEEDLNNANKP
jgi:hypothetical protein